MGGGVVRDGRSTESPNAGGKWGVIGAAGTEEEVVEGHRRTRRGCEGPSRPC